jgi:DNA-binding NtrC family response regulator
VTRLRLRPEAREFFATLSEAIVMNPFSEERRALIARLGVGHADGAWSLEPADYDLVAEVDRRIADLERAGGDSLERFPAEDRPALTLAFLYQIYHREVPQLDAFIEAQLREPDQSLAVPFAADTIGACVRRGIPEAEAIRQFAFSFQLRRAFYFIVASLFGESASIRRLQRQLWNSVFTHDLRTYPRMLMGRMEDFSTLLLGETGTGKGQAAAAIGRSGYIPFDPRTNRFVANFNEAFVAINLSQFPESLIESELFGHRKGAFTGAIENHDGVLAQCSAHGSLFIDEIGDVSVPVQLKLLEVLQDRTFTPVGSRRAQRFHGRVIAATNQPLARLRRDGRFRDDFYYRLCSGAIVVPPLRDRLRESGAELELLVSRLVAKIAGDEHPELSARVLECLDAALAPGYPWPGNVRELEQAVRSVLMTGDYQGDPAFLGDGPEADFADRVRSQALSADELISGYCALLHASLGTYESVAKRVGLDRRTVKKYVDQSR